MSSGSTHNGNKGMHQRKNKPEHAKGKGHSSNRGNNKQRKKSIFKIKPKK
jgi:hypothetical protein